MPSMKDMLSNSSQFTPEGDIDKIQGYLTKYLGPYADQGPDLFKKMQSMYGGLTDDPSSTLQKIGAGYQQDPGYQAALQQSLQAANQAAAAGGFSGSGQSQQMAANIAQQAASKDYGNYMQRALGLYGTGLQGQAGLEGQTFGAGEDMASGLSSYATSLANLKQAQAESAAKQKSGMWSTLGGLAGTALSFL